MRRYHLPIAMSTSLPPGPGNGTERADDRLVVHPVSRGDGDAERIGSLRGASVAPINGRLLGGIALGVVMVTLAVLIAITTVADVHSNDQIDRIHSQGVHVTATVTGCLGLLGGSGSNAAGFSCRATYALDGHSYNEQLPGTTFYRPGTKLTVVAVPSDPALVSPLEMANSEHTSTSVFILPAVLLVVLLGLAGLVVRRRRSARRSNTSQRPPR